MSSDGVVVCRTGMIEKALLHSSAVPYVGYCGFFSLACSVPLAVALAFHFFCSNAYLWEESRSRWGLSCSLNT